MPLWGSSFITDPITPQGVFPCFNQVLSGWSSMVHDCTWKEPWLASNEELHLALPPSVIMKHLSSLLFFLCNPIFFSSSLNIYIFDGWTIGRQGRQGWNSVKRFQCTCLGGYVSAYRNFSIYRLSVWCKWF